MDQSIFPAIKSSISSFIFSELCHMLATSIAIADHALVPEIDRIFQPFLTYSYIIAN